MADQLAFYQVPGGFRDTVGGYDLIDGSDLAMHVERLGTYLKDLDVDEISDFQGLVTGIRRISKIPLDYLIGEGEPVIQPAGPVVYCSLLTKKHRDELKDGFDKLEFILKRAEGEKELEVKEQLLGLEESLGMKGKLWYYLEKIKKALAGLPSGDVLVVFTHW